MPEQRQALVVDDEEGIRFFLEQTLQRTGYAVTVAVTGGEALDRLRDIFFDLVLLDLRLGGRVDGLQVLEAIRWRWPNTVVIILTAHGSLESAMTAIRDGVDGYLLKPVEPEQVRDAIVEAFDRRAKLGSQRPLQGSASEIVSHGPFVIDLNKHVATLDGKALELTPQEFGLLVYLIQNAHRVVSPKELVQVVRQFEPEYANEAREVIKWYIYRLRQRIEPDPDKPKFILNVRGVGYMLGS